ncbi:hypothetical protein SD78_0759 [Bacillus badius]|nr:hypothetical protein SD78_0759 [Bacillus badius]
MVNYCKYYANYKLFKKTVYSSAFVKKIILISIFYSNVHKSKILFYPCRVMHKNSR